MIVVHDWEFLEQENSIYPISVGMVREDGAELYYEFINAPWEKILKDEFLKDNVLPILSKEHKSTLTIRMKVYKFLQEAAGNSSVELWGWYSAYDHVCLAQLFGKMIYLPGFVPMWTNDIRQEAFRLNVRIPNLREPEEKVHHALDDARSEMRMLQWLKDYETNTIRINNSRGMQFGSGNSQFNTFS